MFSYLESTSHIQMHIEGPHYFLKWDNLKMIILNCQHIQLDLLHFLFFPQYYYLVLVPFLFIIKFYTLLFLFNLSN